MTASSARAQSSAAVDGLSPVLSRNRARTADLLGFYGTGRLDRPSLSFVERGSTASVYARMRGSASDFLRRRAGLGIEEDVGNVMRAGAFPGLAPASRFESRYMQMVSPADSLTFRERLVRARHSPLADFAMADKRPKRDPGHAAVPAELPPEVPFSRVTLGLEAGVKMAYDRKLADGWALLHEVEVAHIKRAEPTDETRTEPWNGRAARAFEAAESIDRTRIEPRIGRLYCALLEGNISFAAALLKRLFEYDGVQLNRDLFADDWTLSRHFTRPETIAEILQTCERFMRGTRDAAGPTAVYVFMLWHSDVARRPDAHNLAADIARSWPDSPFAGMVVNMRRTGQSGSVTAP